FRERFVKEGKTQAKWHPLSRPAGAEAEAVCRLLYLARAAGEAPVYVVHLSTRAGLEEIRKAKAMGQQHFGAETCPQYLLLDESFYADPQEGLKALMAPPLRTQSDRDALWEALAGDELDTVATDHCPFTFAKQKQQGARNFTKCPSGAPGVEERLILLYSEGVARGRITLPQLVKYACANPARVAGLYPKKGLIAQGADADLVILDPGKEWIMSTNRMHGASDYTCYEGMRIKGAIERVLLRGKTIALDGNFTGERGDGMYQHRGISSLA
ncbi:MAG: amidohydrolase family protein, partial [Lachnospiraceae bacterium]|nr:amidohydrolase family protein [Lachnospiraceae bacterium]